MSKILSLRSENVKRLTVAEVTPTSPLVLIGGANGSGKTSLLDSILYGLAGANALPAEPVHRGAEKAEVTIKLTDGLVIRRTITATGNAYLKITAADGSNVTSPQKILDELTGKLTFDPMAFMAYDDRKQAETLRRLTGLDFTAHDKAYDALFVQRTEVNRRLKEMRGAVATMPEYKDVPTTEVSSAAILAEIEKAQSHNQQGADLTRAVTDAEQEVANCGDYISEMEQTIESLEAQLAKVRSDLRVAQSDKDAAVASLGVAKNNLAAFKAIDTAPLKAQLATCEQTNSKVRANMARTKAIAEGLAKKAESDALTAKLEAMDADKSAKLAAAKFPVPGLGFKGDTVTYNDFPLNQASDAERQRVSVAIGAALNPRLRVMLIRNASLIDKRNMEGLRQTAEELDLQLWLEVVSEGEECAVVISDGEVVGAVKEEASAAVEPVRKKRAAKSAPAVTPPPPAAFTEEPAVDLSSPIPPGSPF